MKKKELRNYYLQKRKQLNPEIIENWSIKIINQFLKNNDFTEGNICSFLPIKKNNEVNTFLLWENENSLKLYTTKWKTSSNELSIYLTQNLNQLKYNHFDIPEPTDLIEEQDLNILDVILVPLLIFDLKGNRVGYGKGVYDQFLSKIDRSKVKIIGLSFFEPISEIDDINNLDIQLTHCITPTKIYEFKK
jgi:5-formyltetrahydrofolate cyclo-ligase